MVVSVKLPKVQTSFYNYWIIYKNSLYKKKKLQTLMYVVFFIYIIFILDVDDGR